MSQALITPILHSVTHVLQTMALVDSKMGEMFTKAKSEPLRGDVTGVIGWTGAMKGCLTISFSEGAILHIVSSLFGEPCTAPPSHRLRWPESTNFASKPASKTKYCAPQLKGQYLQLYV
jgi:hypothetical protein